MPFRSHSSYKKHAHAHTFVVSTPNRPFISVRVTLIYTVIKFIILIVILHDSPLLLCLGSLFAPLSAAYVLILSACACACIFFFFVLAAFSRPSVLIFVACICACMNMYMYTHAHSGPMCAIFLALFPVIPMRIYVCMCVCPLPSLCTSSRAPAALYFLRIHTYIHNIYIYIYI